MQAFLLAAALALGPQEPAPATAAMGFPWQDLRFSWSLIGPDGPEPQGVWELQTLRLPSGRSHVLLLRDRLRSPDGRVDFLYQTWVRPDDHLRLIRLEAGGRSPGSRRLPLEAAVEHGLLLGVRGGHAFRTDLRDQEPLNEFVLMRLVSLLSRRKGSRMEVDWLSGQDLKLLGRHELVCAGEAEAPDGSPSWRYDLERLPDHDRVLRLWVSREDRQLLRMEGPGRLVLQRLPAAPAEPGEAEASSKAGASPGG